MPTGDFDKSLIHKGLTASILRRKTAPVGNSRELHQKWEESAMHSELEVVEGKPHAFYTNAEAAGWALEFFRQKLGVAE